nr:hypothetical protein CFP56_57834 [Quercus suber]
MVERPGEGRRNWLNMFETISISASAAAIFSAEEGCGRAPPPKRKDIAMSFGCRWQWRELCRSLLGAWQSMRCLLVFVEFVIWGVRSRDRQESCSREGEAWTMR